MDDAGELAPDIFGDWESSCPECGMPKSHKMSCSRGVHARYKEEFGDGNGC